jgi:HSF-type DNA-binding
MTKSSLISSSSWKSLQGVVSEDSSSEDPEDGDVSERTSSTVTTRRKRPHRSSHHTVPVSPTTTRRRGSSASSSSLTDTSSLSLGSSIARGGVACPFPWKLHDMLDMCSEERDPLVTWNGDGTAFCVLNAKAFVQTILPR